MFRFVMGSALVGCTAVASSTIAQGTVPVMPGTFDFNTMVHGEIVTTQYQPMMSIVGTNFHRPFSIVAGFDTNAIGTNDPDLQGPDWAGGNLAGTGFDLGTAIILAENNTDVNGDGILDTPDDEGRRPAGTIDLTFMTPIPFFGFDVIDVEGRMQERTSLDFFLGGALVGSVDIEAFTDPASAYFDPSVVFGNHTANRISPITAAGFGAAGFDRVRINVGGSSAYDTFLVPSPATAALLGLGGLAAARRRRTIR